MKTMSQERAYHAYTNFAQYAADVEMKTAAKKLASMIQSCGLIQTLAFYQDDKKLVVREILRKWLTKPELGLLSVAPNEDIITEVAQLPLSQYRRLRSEAIEYAIWLKRAAEK